MPIFVPDDGLGLERIIVIGEAPGQQEELQRKPFVGPSGQALARWLQAAGLTRRDCYITNVCIAEGQRVLMADLMWKPIEDVAIGDTVLAFDEHGKTRGTELRKWRFAKVTATSSSLRPCIEIMTQQGMITLTEDHVVLAAHKRSSASVYWAKAGRVRSCLARAIVPWKDDTSRLAGFLAGLFVGEGTISVGSAPKSKRSFIISFTQNPGVTFDEGIGAMRAIGFNVGVTASYKQASKAWIKGGVATTMRFLGIVRPTRLLRRFDDLMADPPVIRCRPDRILCKNQVGVQRVFDITTETSTFIVEGFAVHNCPFKPPANKIEAVPAADLEPWIGRLHERIAALQAPVVLVPMGNTALRALAGKTKITRHRGSIYAYRDLNGRTIKVIPTLHPAAVLRQPSWERRCRRDWEQIAADSGFPELRLPEREHFIKPTMDDVRWYVREAARSVGPLALDIETPRPVLGWDPPKRKGAKPKPRLGPPAIACIGFSHEPSFSFTIPTTLQYWGTEAALAEAWAWVEALCTLRVPKVTHNGLFDTFYLATDHGIRLQAWDWDTLAAHHALDAADDHSLAYLASIDTRQPYWKSMRDPKDGDDYAGWEDDKASLLWRYNGIDAAVTRELAGVYAARLEAEGRTGFYRRHYAAMFEPLLALMLHGVRIDEATRATRSAELTTSCADIRGQLAAIAGEPLHGKKDLSSKKVQKFLYETLKLPARVDRKTGRRTAKEVVVRQLMIRFPEKLGAAGALILSHRRQKKLSEFLAEGVADADGRIRCSYKFTTETGRLSSSKNPKGTGRNLQNIDREIRGVFLPDDRLLLECDLSQAESRVVGMLTGDPQMIELARAKPWEFDIHRRNAAIVFGVAADDVTKEQRFLGKKAIHASNYGMAGTKLSEELLNDGYERTADECQAMIEAYLDAHPAIRRWHIAVRSRVLRDRLLVNNWGRMLDFQYERLGDDVFRQAYAFEPQCCDDQTEVLTPAGWVPFPQLSSGVEVAQWDPTTGFIDFVLPSRVVAEPYAGPMASFESARASLLVTPKHRVWHVTTTGVRVDEAQRLIGRAKVVLPVSGRRRINDPRQRPLTRSVVSLLVATQADGTIRPGRIEWHFSKERKIKRLRALAKRAGVDLTEAQMSDGTVCLSASGAWRAVVDQWLPNKRFPWSWLNLPDYLKAVAVLEASLWDSSRSGRAGASFSYLNTDKQSIDVMQALAISIGYRATIVPANGESDRHKVLYRLNLHRTMTTSVEHSCEMAYSGTVYCVTVPTGFFVVRRNGKVSITGNSSIADLLNQWGLIPLHRMIEAQGLRSRINLQVHDSLVVSVPPEEAWAVYDFVRRSLERPRLYAGNALVIPTEAKLGTSWATSIEFKKPPTQEEFEHAIQQLDGPDQEGTGVGDRVAA